VRPEGAGPPITRAVVLGSVATAERTAVVSGTKTTVPAGASISSSPTVKVARPEKRTYISS
jgi:hypothetical protein